PIIHAMRPSHALATIALAVTFVASARADIYQWAYVNPADPSQGKQQSVTLCPDGARIYLGYGFTSLPNLELNKAYLQGASLYAASIASCNLSNADLAQASLYSAFVDSSSFSGADLAGANLEFANCYNSDFSHADMHGAIFYDGSAGSSN